MTNNIPTLTPEIKKLMKTAFDEILSADERIEIEKDHIKEIFKRLESDSGVDKKLIKKMADAYSRGNFEETVNNFDIFKELYNEVLVK